MIKTCIAADTSFDQYGTGPTTEAMCRVDCARVGYLFAGLRSGQCGCLNVLPPATECSDVSWDVMISSAFLQASEETLTLMMSINPPIYDDMLYSTDEAVVIQITPISLDALYTVDYGDGTANSEAITTSFSHVYQVEGTFTISVTARYKEETAESSYTIQVLFIDRGIEPTIFVQELSDMSFFELGVETDIVISGDSPISCDLMIGDVFWSISTVDFYHQETPAIPGILPVAGTTELSVACSNRFGHAQNVTLPVRVSEVKVTALEWQESAVFEIPISLQDDTDILLLVDGAMVPFSLQPDKIYFDTNALRSPGVHIIGIYKADMRIFAGQVIYEEPLSNPVSLWLSSDHVATDHFVTLNMSLNNGDPCHIFIDFKNGSQLSMYSMGSQGFQHSFILSYEAQGAYDITVRTTNSRNSFLSEKTIVVEDLVQPFSVYTADITSLDTPAIFTLHHSNSVRMIQHCCV